MMIRFRKMAKPTRVQVAWLIVFSVLMTVLLEETHIGIGQTRSLPYKYYFTIRHYPVQRGDLVAIKGHTTLYHPEPLPYVKRIIGLPGDTITLMGNCMFVAGYLVGKLRSSSKDGKPLSPLKTKVIPEGYVFAAATAWDSFDSRYEEYGLVKKEHLKGKTWGFWRD